MLLSAALAAVRQTTRKEEGSKRYSHPATTAVSATGNGKKDNKEDLELDLKLMPSVNRMLFQVKGLRQGSGSDLRRRTSSSAFPACLSEETGEDLAHLSLPAVRAGNFRLFKVSDLHDEAECLTTGLTPELVCGHWRPPVFWKQSRLFRKIIALKTTFGNREMDNVLR
jgi:hypothetical protein